MMLTCSSVCLLKLKRTSATREVLSVDIFIEAISHYTVGVLTQALQS